MEVRTWIGRRETPCIAVVDSYHPGYPAKLWGPWEDSYEGVDPEVEWHLETAKSHIKSRRFDVIMTQEDAERIEGELIAAMQNRWDD